MAHLGVEIRGAGLKALEMQSGALDHGDQISGGARAFRALEIDRPPCPKRGATRSTASNAEGSPEREK